VSQLYGIKDDFHASVFQVFAYTLLDDSMDNLEHEHVIRTVSESMRYHPLPLCVFAVSKHAAVARAFNVSTFPAVVLLKEYLPENDDVEVLYTGEFKVTPLTKFITAHAYPLVAPVDSDRKMQLYGADRHLPLMLIFTAVAPEVQNQMIAVGSVAAKKFRGKMAVLLMNGEDKVELAKSMGLTTTTPGVVRARLSLVHTDTRRALPLMIRSQLCVCL
jgi:hypothetical protein